MLQKIELLVGRGNEEILSVVILALGVDLAVVADNPIALLFAEGRIGQDQIVGLPAVAEQRIAGFDRAVAAGDVVQIKVHRAEPHDLGDDVDRDRIAVYTSALRASGFGLVYGTSNLGKIIGPAGLAVIAGASNFVSPKATIAAIVPAFAYFPSWYLLAILAFLLVGIETRGRTIEELDASFKNAISTA